MIRCKGLLVITVAAVLACGGGAPPAEKKNQAAPGATTAHETKDSSVRLTAEAARRSGLQVVEVGSRPVADEVRAPGVLALNADRTVSVGSFIEGIVRECCKSVGDFVRKDEELAEVHSHATHELLASYRQVLADRRASEGELELARQELARAERLLELKAGSLRAVQQARAAERRAESAKLSADAAVEGVRAHFEYLGVEPQAGEGEGELPHLRVIVRSPIDGWVMSRMTTQGDVVTPAEHLYEISDLSTLWLIAQVSEEDLRFIDVGMSVELSVKAYPGDTFRGRVTQIGNELDPENRTVQVRCTVPNRGRRLKAGMYAEVTLRSGESREALTVPLTAVQRLDDESIVFVDDGDETFRARRVELGRENGDSVEVLAGLEAGDRVVAHGSFVLKSEMLKSELSEE